MKALNKICQVLAVVFGLASLVLFFTDFASVITDGATEKLVGAQLAFGSKVTTAADVAYDLAKSAKILFCFWMTVIAVLISGFSFKSKGLRFAAPGFGVIPAVFMLVIALSKPINYVDIRPMQNVTELAYTPFVLITAIALILFVIASVAYLLIDDYLEVLASKGEKRTIFQKIVHFFRDYKSEVKKIVWPGFKEVMKNTLIVLIMCLLAGILIWLIDFGLGQLLNLVLGA